MKENRQNLAVTSFGCAWLFSKGKDGIRSYDPDVILTDWDYAPNIWVILRNQEIPDLYKDRIHTDFPDAPPPQGAVYCREVNSDAEKIFCIESLEAMTFNQESSGLLIIDCFSLDFSILLSDISLMLHQAKIINVPKEIISLNIDMDLLDYFNPNGKLIAARREGKTLLNHNCEKVGCLILNSQYLEKNKERIKGFRKKPELIETNEMAPTAGRKLLMALTYAVGNTRYPVFGPII